MAFSLFILTISVDLKNSRSVIFVSLRGSYPARLHCLHIRSQVFVAAAAEAYDHHVLFPELQLAQGRKSMPRFQCGNDAFQPCQLEGSVERFRIGGGKKGAAA